MGFTACTEPQCLYKGDLYLFTLPLDSYSKDVGTLRPYTMNVRYICTHIKNYKVQMELGHSVFYKGG